MMYLTICKLNGTIEWSKVLPVLSTKLSESVRDIISSIKRTSRVRSCKAE